jgi:hypothetical protein
MFVRQVSIHLKADVASTFARTVENEALPILRKQQGFQDEITLVSGRDAVGISFWDSKENAEAYNKAGYADVLKVLSAVSDGTPQLRTFAIANSTLHKTAAIVAA